MFKGFFGIKNINERLIREYDSFKELQSKKLFESSYEYIEPTYFWNSEIKKGKLIENIFLQIENDGAQLIILEAAAGYGKTCTSYELIKIMANDERLQYAPIFTELSKNRKAALFRYVLLDEIDKKFTSLSSQLVLQEIRNGMVPLIIDGFDELISRSSPNMSNSILQEDDSQTMLDTIAELFDEGCKTKVVLTSRKSAIFTGDIFNEWIKYKLPNCNVTRISIEEPTIQDWLGYEKLQFLKTQRIPFTNIVNPILLAFMRSMSIEKFMEKCSNVEKVIDYYFESLLNREIERQALQLSKIEQYEIMKLFAKDFVEFDIVSEELSFVKELFQDIIHEKFNDYNERYYITEERPTEQEFATKLAGHALLNRTSPMKNQIGFINDFIFGIFIGEIMIEKKINMEEVGEKYIDIACTAYASRSSINKAKLLDVVLPYIRKLNYEQQFDVELKLASTIQQDYKEHYFSNRSFNQDIYFDGKYKFQNCTFRNCTFNKCYLMTSAFEECSFYDCRFYDISVLRDTNYNCRLIFSNNCSGYEIFAEKAAHEDPLIVEENYEKVILSKFYNSRSQVLRDALHERVLLNTKDSQKHQELERTLENLKKENILFKYNHQWVINKEKIGEIRNILGK